MKASVVMLEPVVLNTVGDLINWLELLGRERLLVYNNGGLTDHVLTSDVDILDEGINISPVSINSRQV